MVGENADHIIAGDGSVDAAHSKSFVYIGHTYLYSRSEELVQQRCQGVYLPRRETMLYWA